LNLAKAAPGFCSSLPSVTARRQPFPAESTVKFQFMRLSRPLALPRVQPIVPILRSTPFSDPAWRFEPKYDGFRGFVYLTGGKCANYSKPGNAFSKFDELRSRLRAELPRLEVILDGEIIAIDEGRWRHELSRGPSPTLRISRRILESFPAFRSG